MDLLIVVLWVVSGWWACRRLVKDWFDEFGDYEGIPWPILPIFFIFGPAGFVTTLFIVPPKALKGKNFNIGPRLFFLPKVGN